MGIPHFQFFWFSFRSLQEPGVKTAFHPGLFLGIGSHSRGISMIFILKYHRSFLFWSKRCWLVIVNLFFYRFDKAPTVSVIVLLLLLWLGLKPSNSRHKRYRRSIFCNALNLLLCIDAFHYFWGNIGLGGVIVTDWKVRCAFVSILETVGLWGKVCMVASAQKLFSVLKLPLLPYFP